MASALIKASIRTSLMMMLISILAPTAYADDWQRTVVLIYGKTQPGQDLYLRGGIDWSYARQSLGLECKNDRYLCAVPIRHRVRAELKNRKNDLLLDWYGAESGQDSGVVGTPLSWTTNQTDYFRQVENHGYGYSEFNIYGRHYWLLDADVDCDRTANGWFELKSYITNGPGWERDANQSNTPYDSRNHMARCGYINVFRRNDSGAQIVALNNEPPPEYEPPIAQCELDTLPPHGSGNEIYIAPQGSDDTGTGSSSAPYFSIRHATRRASPGDTIIASAGTYNLNSEQFVSANGTPSAWITIKSEAGGRAVFDGSNANLPDEYRGLITVGGSYILIQGIEVQNSPGSGLKFYMANNVVVADSVIHDVEGLGIGGSGDYITLQNNEVFNAVLSNENGQRDQGGGWFPAVASGHFDSPYRRSRNWLVEGNYFHDNWGECLDALYLEDSTFSNNRIHDCYSTNVYIDNASNIDVTGNIIYNTTNRYDTRINPHRAHGITFSFESKAHGVGCESGLCLVEDIKISNNIITGAGVGILYFDGSNNGYDDIVIENNVVYGQEREAIWISPSNNANGQNTVRNNILYAGRQTGPMGIGNSSRWQVGYNSAPNGGLPSYAQNTYNGNPQLASPNNSGNESGFGLLPTSPLIERGSTTSNVAEDYWCRPRVGMPDIGVHEAR